MPPKPRPGLLRFQQDQREYGNLPGFGTNNQLEAIGKQRAHHQTHLIFGRSTGGASLDVEAVGKNPARHLQSQGLFLIAGDLVRKCNQCHDWMIDDRKAPPNGREETSRTQGNVASLVAGTTLVGLDGNNLELHFVSCGLQGLSPYRWRMNDSNGYRRR